MIQWKLWLETWTTEPVIGMFESLNGSLISVWTLLAWLLRALMTTLPHVLPTLGICWIDRTVGAIIRLDKWKALTNVGSYLVATAMRWTCALIKDRNEMP